MEPSGRGAGGRGTGASRGLVDVVGAVEVRVVDEALPPDPAARPRHAHWRSEADNRAAGAGAAQRGSWAAYQDPKKVEPRLSDQWLGPMAFGDQRVEQRRAAGVLSDGRRTGRIGAGIERREGTRREEGELRGAGREERWKVQNGEEA